MPRGRTLLGPHPPQPPGGSGGAIAYLGYCVYFDLKRRGDPLSGAACGAKEEPSSRRLRDGRLGEVFSDARMAGYCGIQQRMKSCKNSFGKRYKWENFGYREQFEADMNEQEYLEDDPD
ncbi:Tomm20-Like Protein 1 [Manis pentadactyla]|nr:Tomm20-Like Protein 1 [Manis pentadactyla]